MNSNINSLFFYFFSLFFSSVPVEKRSAFCTLNAFFVYRYKIRFFTNWAYDLDRFHASFYSFIGLSLWEVCSLFAADHRDFNESLMRFSV